jgi:hypothetical protein
MAMNRLAVRLIVACTVLFVFAQAARAQTVYSYTGNAFTDFSCSADPNNFPGNPGGSCTPPDPLFTSYGTGDHITATLTLDAPLPAKTTLVNEDLWELPGFQFVISDGRQVFSFWSVIFSAMAVETDSSGRIIGWEFYLSNSGGTLWTTWNPSIVNGVDVASYPNASHPDFAYNANSPGTWSDPAGPEAQVRNLRDSLSDPALGLTQGQISSLTDKLNNVIASIQDTNYAQAINQLEAFIKEVRAKAKNGSISASVAAMLIAAANAIIQLLPT